MSRIAALVLPVLGVLSGCQSSSDRAASKPELVVFAAASLREAFTSIKADFEQKHQAQVSFNFAGTQELRTQVEHGARADVIASADERQMQALRAAGHVVEPVVFVENEPVIVVHKGSDGALETLADLPRAARIVIGAPEVPIGRYTLTILDRASRRFGADFRARVEAHVVSRELNVRQVLAKVSLGEADAGIVYRSDVRGVGESVRIISIPADVNVIARYPIAVTSESKRPELGRAWVIHLLSAEGQRALVGAGFRAPVSP